MQARADRVKKAGTRRSAARRARLTKNPAITDATRSVPWGTKLKVAVRAGGRCEFPGCNRALFEHHVTLRDGNFGEFAHIVALSCRGPRGGDCARPRDPHAVTNLLLLCPQCHKLIDDEPHEFPRPVLESFKTDHENRIRHVTGLAPNQRTVVVQLKARINGAAVDIPLSDVVKAVAPLYPTDRQGHIIDLTNLEDEDDYFRLARNKVRRCIERLYEPGMDADKVYHLSVFALAPIPMLVYLGVCLSNKIPVNLFQRHRDVKDWAWKKGGPTVEYAINVLKQGRDPTKVAVVLPLSGAIPWERLPSMLDDAFTLYEIALVGRQPSTDFLRTHDDLLRFETTYRELLARVVREHPLAQEIHLFPAVPAPVAVACGHQLLPKAHPPLLVYDYVATRGGFIPRLRTDDHDGP